MSVPLPQTMQAMEIRNKALAACRVAVPVAASGELLIRVAYAGINHADQLQVDGNYAPPAGASPLPGLEISGTVAALGDAVSGFTVGQQVCALLSGGGYAEYVTVPASQVLPLPAGVALKEAASIPEAAATSVMALLDMGNLVAGERVLVHGGAAGLGILMTQIARCAGADVYATVGNDIKAEFLGKLGINAFDYRARPFAELILEATRNEGVDLIIDILGGPCSEAHLRLLRPGGRLITLAMLAGSELPSGMKMTRILMNQLTWRGAMLRSRTAAQKAAIMQVVAAKIWPNLADGSIKPVIDSVFALADAKKALDRMQERLHMGKILLEVAAE